jgi:hypothetical protein
VLALPGTGGIALMSAAKAFERLRKDFGVRPEILQLAERLEPMPDAADHVVRILNVIMMARTAA